MSVTSTEETLKKRNLILSTLLQVAIDSDSDNELLEVACNYLKRKQKKPRLAIKNYIENVANLYDHDDFRSHFRLRRDTFEYVLQILGPHLIETNVNGVGSHTYPPQIQLLVAISMLANQEVYRTVAEKFDISKSTAWIYVQKVCRVLVKLAKNYTYWPTGQEARSVIEKFKVRQAFPGVQGAIDGTHIPITAPRKDQASYCNRHQYHSIILQGVCDANYKFLDVFAGYPGSCA